MAAAGSSAAADTIKEGYLLKLSKLKIKWDRRYYILGNNGKLRYFADKAKKNQKANSWFKENAFAFKGEYNLHGARVVKLEKKDTGHPHSFGVAPRGLKRMIVLRANDEEDRTEWINEMCKVSSVNFHGTVHTQPGSTSILEGQLRKQGGNVRSWKVRYFVLQAHAIQYFGNKMDSKYIDKIPLSLGAKVLEKSSDDFQGSKFPFSVQSLQKDAREYILDAEDEVTRKSWVEAINVISDVNLRRGVSAGVSVAGTELHSRSEQNVFRQRVRSLSSIETKEGWLKKLGGKIAGSTWQQRYFRIEDRGPVPKLSWYKAPGEATCLGSIELKDIIVEADVEETKQRTFVFCIKHAATPRRKRKSGEKTYWLRASSRQEMEEWIVSLETNLGLKPSYRIARTPSYFITSSGAQGTQTAVFTFDHSHLNHSHLKGMPGRSARSGISVGRTNPASAINSQISAAGFQTPSDRSRRGSNTKGTPGSPKDQGARVRHSFSALQMPKSTGPKISVTTLDRKMQTKKRSQSSIITSRETSFIQDEFHFGKVSKMLETMELKDVDPIFFEEIRKHVDWNRNYSDIFRAVRLGDRSTCSLLLKEGAPIDVCLYPHKFSMRSEWPYFLTDNCHYKDSLLHVAVRFRCSTMVKYLVTKGANPFAKNDQGRDCIELLDLPAATNNRGASKEELLELLKWRGNVEEPGDTKYVSGVPLFSRGSSMHTDILSSKEENPKKVEESEEKRDTLEPGRMLLQDSFERAERRFSVTKNEEPGDPEADPDGKRSPSSRGSRKSRAAGSERNSLSVSVPDRENYVEPTSLKEGYMYKRGETHKAWRERYFILLPQELRYYEKRPQSGDSETIKNGMKGTIPLIGVEVGKLIKPAAGLSNTTFSSKPSRRRKSTTLKQATRNMVKSVFSPRSGRRISASNAAVNSPRRRVNSVFSPRSDPGIISEFTLTIPGGKRTYVIGFKSQDIAESWLEAVSEQVEASEKQVLLSRQASSMEGYLHVYDSKANNSWTRYYFILKGS